jgi:hypothetical protein
MTLQLCPQCARRPDFILDAEFVKIFGLFVYLLLLLSRVHRAGHKKDEAFDVSLFPVLSIPQKLFGSFPNFAWWKFLVAFALTDFAGVDPFAPRYQIDSSLKLSVDPENLAGTDALFELKEVAAKLLKWHRVKFVKRYWFAGVEAKCHL